MPARAPSPRQRPPSKAAAPRGAPRPAPLAERDIADLQRRLDAVPAPLDPLDVVMLDGFLCGVLLQPEPIPASRWLRHVADVDGRPLPAGFEAAPLHRLVERRHAELGAAIAGRRWFDPWVFELDRRGAARRDREDSGRGGEAEADDESRAATEAVYPWVAGFATALELFPQLMQLPAERIDPPLALVYRHLGPDDLEDADALQAEIDALEPAVDLAEAVEGLVRATLLLADVTRPLR